MATTFKKEKLCAGGNPLLVRITTTWDNSDLTPTAFAHGGPFAKPDFIITNIKTLGTNRGNVSVETTDATGLVTFIAAAETGGSVASLVTETVLGWTGVVANQDGTSFLPT